MSADNGIFILLDLEENAVVLNTRRDYLYELFDNDANPWVIDGSRWAQIYYLIAGHTVYQGIKTAMDRAVRELKCMEICEHGIVTILVKTTFKEVSDRYFRAAEESMQYVIGTPEQKDALKELAKLPVFRDILLYPEDMHFVTVYNRVDNCYHALSEDRDEQWKMQAEAWLQKYEVLL